MLKNKSKKKKSFSKRNLVLKYPNATILKYHTITWTSFLRCFAETEKHILKYFLKFYMFTWKPLKVTYKTKEAILRILCFYLRGKREGRNEWIDMTHADMKSSSCSPANGNEQSRNNCQPWQFSGDITQKMNVNRFVTSKGM